MTKRPECFIWGTRADDAYPKGTAMFCDSPRAGGKYWIGFQALTIMQIPENWPWINRSFKARLTSWLIERREEGEEYPGVTGSKLNEIKSKQTIPMRQRQRNLMIYIKRSLANPADTFPYKREEDHQLWEMMAWSESTSREQVSNLLDCLEESGQLKRVKSASSSFLAYLITNSGHASIRLGYSRI